MVERRTFWLKGPGFNLFTALCLRHSGETVKAVGPFYLVPMPGAIKDPTQGNGKYLLSTH